MTLLSVYIDIDTEIKIVYTEHPMYLSIGCGTWLKTDDRPFVVRGYRYEDYVLCIIELLEQFGIRPIGVEEPVHLTEEQSNMILGVLSL